MKNISALLLRREWTRYHSFGGSWLFIWGIYLVIFLLTGQSGSFFLVFLPMIMSYGALVTASQAGEAVLAGTEDFLLPVPLRRVIWARYQLVFLIGLASSLLCIIMLFLGRLLHPSDSFYSPVFLFGMGMLTAGASAVFVGPIIFRWEFGRSRVLNTLIIGLGAAVGAGSSALVIIALEWRRPGDAGSGAAAGRGCSSLGAGPGQLCPGGEKTTAKAASPMRKSPSSSPKPPPNGPPGAPGGPFCMKKTPPAGYCRAPFHRVRWVWEDFCLGSGGG